MKTFSLNCEVTVSAYTKVRARSLKEAIEIGKERQAVLGGVGSGADEYEEWIIEDADGMPAKVHGE